VSIGTDSNLDTVPVSVFDEIIDRRQVPALKMHPMVLGDDAQDMFAAGVADMDFKAPAAVLDAMQRRLDHGVFGYETVADRLISGLTAWLQARHGWQVESAHILRSPNVLNSLAFAVSLFSELSDGIIVQPPVFFDFYDVVAENQRKLIENSLILKNGQYQIDFAGLEHVASDPRNKMLLLCNPHNPVGRVWRASELRQIGDICERHNVLVVADEIHGDIVYPGYKYTPFMSLGSIYANNAIGLVSPAKSFNIAACCSAFTIITNEKMRDAFKAESSRVTANKNNAFANVAMEAAYNHGGPWLDAAIRYLHANLQLVETRLGQLSNVSIVKPEGTFLVWFDFRALGLSPDELTEFLRTRCKWAATRGQSFGVQGEGFARVNIACPRAKLEQALDRLVEALEGFPEEPA
jgi:cysteine-S-conjugate beta-lyase